MKAASCHGCQLTSTEYRPTHPICAPPLFASMASEVEPDEQTSSGWVSVEDSGTNTPKEAQEIDFVTLGMFIIGMLTVRLLSISPVMLSYTKHSLASLSVCFLLLLTLNPCPRGGGQERCFGPYLPRYLPTWLNCGMRAGFQVSFCIISLTNQRFRGHHCTFTFKEDVAACVARQCCHRIGHLLPPAQTALVAPSSHLTSKHTTGRDQAKH